MEILVVVPTMTVTTYEIPMTVTTYDPYQWARTTRNRWNSYGLLIQGCHITRNKPSLRPRQRVGSESLTCWPLNTHKPRKPGRGNKRKGCSCHTMSYVIWRNTCNFNCEYIEISNQNASFKAETAWNRMKLSCIESITNVLHWCLNALSHFPVMAWRCFSMVVASDPNILNQAHLSQGGRWWTGGRWWCIHPLVGGVHGPLPKWSWKPSVLEDKNHEHDSGLPLNIYVVGTFGMLERLPKLDTPNHLSKKHLCLKTWRSRYCSKNKIWAATEPWRSDPGNPKNNRKTTYWGELTQYNF